LIIFLQKARLGKNPKFESSYCGTVIFHRSPGFTPGQATPTFNEEIASQKSVHNDIIRVVAGWAG
jgi:hypothetical protein